MATRTDLPRIPGPKPTFLNYTMGIGSTIGGLIGYFAPTVLTLVAGTSLPPLAFIAAAAAPGIIGMVVGSVMGKARMEREQVEGREVKQPTLWNRGLGFGLIGAIARKNEMEKEVMQAEGMVRSGHAPLGMHMQLSQGHAMGLTQQVTADDMALLNSRMRGGEGQRADFAQAVLQEQALAQHQAAGKA